MDVKYILSSVANEAVKLGASGKLLDGVRLSGAVNGDRGEGYWLLYEDNLVLLYRRLGERDYEGVCGDPGEWSFADYREEKYALMLQANYNSTAYFLEFTPAERNSAEVILELITQAHADPQTLYPETLLVMAGLFAVLGTNGHEEFALELLGKELYRAGRRYSAEHTLVEMVSLGNKLFTTEQKESVLINLIEQRMSDSEWQSEEAAALRELADVWALPVGYFENCAGILLKRRELGLLFQNKQTGENAKNI
ncbi:MAG: hypothetical protein J6Q81_06390 [Lentisphaeria bacterium]|nr:hypothetical protein [Lentisphaeria bacterium]